MVHVYTTRVGAKPHPRKYEKIRHETGVHTDARRVRTRVGCYLSLYRETRHCFFSWSVLRQCAAACTVTYPGAYPDRQRDPHSDSYAGATRQRRVVIMQPERSEDHLVSAHCDHGMQTCLHHGNRNPSEARPFLENDAETPLRVLLLFLVRIDERPAHDVHVK